MKHFFQLLGIISIASLLLTSCEKLEGKGPVVAQDRVYSGFDAVSISISGKVIHRVGNNFSLRIHAQQNILDIIQTRMEGDELIIKFKDGKNIRSHKEILVEIVSPVLKRISLAGSADMELQDDLDQSELLMSLSGSGNINVAGHVNLNGQLRASLSGSGNITVAGGIADDTWLRIAGSGNIHTDAVTCNSSYAEITGSGNIRVHATQSLDVRIQGSGSVFYRGTPQITSSVTGSGKLMPI